MSKNNYFTRDHELEDSNCTNRESETTENKLNKNSIDKNKIYSKLKSEQAQWLLRKLTTVKEKDKFEEDEIECL